MLEEVDRYILLNMNVLKFHPRNIDGTLETIKLKKWTYPVEAFTKNIATVVRAPQVEACMPEATCVSGAVRSG